MAADGRYGELMNKIADIEFDAIKSELFLYIAEREYHFRDIKFYFYLSSQMLRETSEDAKE